jgi:uncharacterized protein (TIGR03435 family)
MGFRRLPSASVIRKIENGNCCGSGSVSPKMKTPPSILLFAANLACLHGVAAAQPPAFAVASIRPSVARVQFESDGRTTITPGALRMQDVTIETCIKWAYGVQRPQVSGPNLLTSERYDITAKADSAASEDELKAMMRSLLTERFQLSFHHEQREMKAIALTVGRDGPHFKQATSDETPYRENMAMGSKVRALTMQEFADFLAGPLEKPVVDHTGLTGRWDFAFDFTKYMTDPPQGLDDYLRVLNETLQGELDLKLDNTRATVDVLVIDHVQKPTAN